MSRLSNFAMEFVPSNRGNILYYLKQGMQGKGNFFDSNASSYAPWSEVGSLRDVAEQSKIEISGFPVYSGSNSMAISQNEPSNYFKQSSNFNPSSTFASLDFNYDLNMNQPNSFASNLFDTNFGRSPVSRMTQSRNVDSLLNEFNSKSLESSTKALWNDAECNTRFQNISLDSVMPDSTDKVPRIIVGRGAGYYERYGTNCISIPNVPLNYPPIRKFETSPAEALGNRDRSSRRKQSKNAKMECAFCKNIGSSEDYKTHWLKNSQNVITCPMLRAYTCPLCGNCGGDKAHTVRYCPLKRQRLAEDFQRTKSEPITAKGPSPIGSERNSEFAINSVLSNTGVSSLDNFNSYDAMFP